MNVVTTVADLRSARAGLAGGLGLVPTMGYLHAGHLALVRAARAECQSVAASIFVNPTQFGPGEDYRSYPRDLEQDLRHLRESGVSLVFVPPVEEMYPPGFATYVDVGPLGERLEGAARPGHFRGVATVVARLFNLFGPRRAYFGQKDAQQCAVIRQLVRDLGFPVEVAVVPTVREPDGLALSSRNVYLDRADRAAAPVLYRGLLEAAEAYGLGEGDADRLREIVRARVQTEPRVKLEYVSVASADGLEELTTVDRPAVVSLAARVGRARLIDNVALE